MARIRHFGCATLILACLGACTATPQLSSTKPQHQQMPDSIHRADTARATSTAATRSLSPALHRTDARMASSGPGSRVNTNSRPLTWHAVNAKHRIGPRDILTISVFDLPELSQSVRVTDVGTISVPLIGELRAAGRTTRQLEHDLARALRKNYVHNPQVSVLLKNNNSRRVTIEGAVRAPGVYPLDGGLSLLQLIATARGLSKNAGSTAVILRKRAGIRHARRFDVTRIRTGRSADPQLLAGDVVIVDRSRLQEGFDALIRALPIASTLALL